MEYYWEIVLKDGTTVDVVPSAVATVRSRWDEKKPIHFEHFSVNPYDIDDFRETSKPHGQPLIEAAAQAFNEEMVNPDGSVVVRWVKKHVTTAEANRLLQIPSYRKIQDDRGMVVVAFRVPVHEIDTQKVSYCTAEEEAQLTRH